MPMTLQRINRRDVLKAASLAAARNWTSGAGRLRAANSPNEKLRVACIGIGGQGRANLNPLGKERDVEIVALCDVDDERAGDAYKKFPAAQKFADFRRMFDSLEKQIDAVAISTPDHTHYHAALWAMRRGKHVYLEKPLAHDLWEVRELTKLAAEKKLATQLGAQRHAISGLRAGVEIVRSGVLGTISEVHSWVGGDRGMPKVPTDMPPVPAHVKWDLWLGSAAERPYHPTYCAYGWRFWWDFGTGETGNWGCHILDIPFWALDLKSPAKVEASGPPIDAQTTPKAMHVRFDFAAVGKQSALALHWHHVKDAPAIFGDHADLAAAGGAKLAKGMNNLFIGSDGILACGFGGWKLLPGKKFAGYIPPKTLADSPGFHREWINACRGGAQATCNFDYTGPLAEAVLLGNVAYRAAEAFTWDAANLKTVGSDRAQALVRRDYRKGWET